MSTGVYLGGPITGLTYRQAQQWRTLPELRNRLALDGWEAVSPLDQHAAPEDVDVPLDAFFEEQVGESVASVIAGDLRMIRECGACLFYFTGAERASIGSSAELGYAYALGKPIVSVVGVGDIHWHPFVTELSTHVVSRLSDAALALGTIANQRRGIPYA